VSAGAALIWGHHPHVLQPAEWKETAFGKSLVIYSLGNALFDQGGLSNTRNSALVMVSLDAHGVTKVQAIPFCIDVSNSRLFLPGADVATKILSQLGPP
jgi:poly-gamma-glutamate capsule biosynthesis protein CapA/YwtB (metallophosphatase superfamily)